MNGRKRLHNFLADMGLPLVQCKQSFSSMDSDIRASCKDLLIRHAPKFGLHDITYSSFVARFGYRCKISAADCVLTLISAIDYCDPGDEDRQGRFLRALELLNPFNVAQLEKQITQAKSMVSNIAENVGYFVELHYVICAGPFLFGAVTEDANKHQLVSNPLILDILSYCALLAHSTLTKSKRAKELPFVLTVPLPCSDCSVIIGIPSISSEEITNSLHVYFIKASERAKITIVSRAFYSSEIVIRTSDRARFFDALITVMTS